MAITTKKKENKFVDDIIKILQFNYDEKLIIFQMKENSIPNK